MIGRKDAGPFWTSSFGIAGAAFTSADQSAAPAAVTSAPTSGKKLVVTDALISVGATGQTVSLTEETSGTLIARFYMAANTSFMWKPRSKTKLATADKRLMVQTSAGGNVAVTVHYYSE